jgi:hypothetical protein
VGFRILTVLMMTALGCAGQGVAAHRLLIRLPTGTNPAGVMIRYALAGQSFGGWAQRAGDQMVIDTMMGNTPATRIKAVAYIPGCAIQTVDLHLSGAVEEQTALACRNLHTTSLAGRLLQSDLLSRPGIDLQVFYIARWAHDWLGLADASVLTIPVKSPAVVNADGYFQIWMPDFAQDDLAKNSGELEIWAVNTAGRERLAQLIVRSPRTVIARMSGVKIQSEYPSEVTFTVCAISHGTVHDHEGFAKRTDLDACERPLGVN